MYKLENEFAKVEISNHAAEIVSFLDKSTNSERMYQPLEGFWQGRNPILFPQVSSTEDQKYYIGEKEYTMGNHGFVRNAEFKLDKATDTQVTLYFEDNEETLKQYPYHFRLSVTYCLEGKKLLIKYQILNKSSEVMSFGFGLHPAFKVPVFENEVYEDYHIDFTKKEEITTLESDYVLNNQVNLSRAMFQKLPTLFFKNLKSEVVELKCNNYGVRIGIKNFPILAVWTPNDAPFVCIEPWMTEPVKNPESKHLENRKDNIKLAANDTYLQEYFIELI